MVCLVVKILLLLFFFFFLRSAVSGTYRHVATVSGLYPDFKILKKKNSGSRWVWIWEVSYQYPCWTHVGHGYLGKIGVSMQHRIQEVIYFTLYFDKP